MDDRKLSTHELALVATASSELFLQCRELTMLFRDVQCASDLKELVAVMEQAPAAIYLLDAHLPGLAGMKEVVVMLQRYRSSKIIVITESRQDETALELLRAGASGYCPQEQLGHEVVKACSRVMAGEVWFERRILSKLLYELIAEGKGVATDVTGQLTPREQDVTKLVSEGLCQKSIASVLDISEYTVRNHLRNIFEKTGVSSRLQLALLIKDS